MLNGLSQRLGVDGERRQLPAIYLSVTKATIALTITISLILTRPWAGLLAHPTALSGTVLVVVAGFPGKTVGGCMQALGLGTAGLVCGVVAYGILAALCRAPVAQGFIWAFYVYLMACVRYKGAKYISCYLYAVLFAFNGIYDPILGDRTFDRSWLLSNFAAYAWGIAIVFIINLVVWPVTSEQELRRLLVQSLHHVSALAHLTCKTYAREVLEPEIEVRRLLVHIIRTDYLALAARFDEAGWELPWSRWTFNDWKQMIARVQGLQQALITSASALEAMDMSDRSGALVTEHLLDSDQVTGTFSEYRRGIDMVIASINEEICHKKLHRFPDETVPVPLPPSSAPGGPTPALEKRVTPAEGRHKIDTVSDRLREEVRRSEARQASSRRNSLHRGRSGRQSEDVFGAEASAALTEDQIENDLENVRPEKRTDGRHTAPRDPADAISVEYLRRSWTTFANAQANALSSLIRDGALKVEDEMQIEKGMPSLRHLYAERLSKAWTPSLLQSSLVQRRPSRRSDRLVADSESEDSLQEEAPCSDALTKSYSLLFGLGQFTDELIGLHAITRRQRPVRLQPYALQNACAWFRSTFLPRGGLRLGEALAILHGNEYVPPNTSVWQRLAKIEQWIRSDHSLYALKVACGATIYAVFLLTPDLQKNLFLRLNMTTSLITLSGTGLGSLYGMVVLEIFQNVGGYRYNPFGIAAAFALGVAGSSVLFYKFPKYYTGALLLQTGCGAMFVLEWLYNELPTVEDTLKQPYDPPPLRFAYTLASLGISIVISAFFQLVILRTPARRKLRLQIANVTFALSAYNMLLQSHVNVVAPGDDAPNPPEHALVKVHQELVARENQIQAAILALGPTFEFAKLEPTFGQPFKGDVILQIIRSHQVVLDRLREARTAVGISGFSTLIHSNFCVSLYPYRLHSQRLMRTLFYLGATSLLSKTSLDRDVPSSKATWVGFEHDALVLSRRLSQLPEGPEEMQKSAYLRYWFFLKSLNAVSSELEALERHLGVWFGKPDETDLLML
ncbi:hypothetical protein OIV83_000812 [Microbotryomycetes sp. JL201]|nr:hypothetical protein OIV83_000812 [Microbotryomycetes sp. JL201]